MKAELFLFFGALTVIKCQELGECEWRFGPNDLFFYNLSNHYALFETMGPVTARNDATLSAYLSVCNSGTQECNNANYNGAQMATYWRTVVAPQCQRPVGQWERSPDNVTLINPEEPGEGLRMDFYNGGISDCFRDSDGGRSNPAYSTLFFNCDMEAVGDTFTVESSPDNCDWVFNISSRWACGRECYEHADCPTQDFYCNRDGMCFPKTDCYIYHDPIAGEECLGSEDWRYHTRNLRLDGCETLATNNNVDNIDHCTELCEDGNNPQCNSVNFDSSNGQCSVLYCQDPCDLELLANHDGYFAASRCGYACLSHADCKTAEYCDLDGICIGPCSDCLQYGDAIDGKCPQCSERKCSSHSECGDGYCDIDRNCWFSCEECRRWNDPVDGMCPQCSPDVECRGHGDCDIKDYCNVVGKCRPSVECNGFRDSIDEVCPSIKAAGCCNCHLSHSQAGCCNAEISECVCEIDPSCCSSTWSDTCAELAITTCGCDGSRILTEGCNGAGRDIHVIGESVGGGNINSGCWIFEESNWWCHNSYDTWVLIDTVSTSNLIGSFELFISSAIYGPTTIAVSAGHLPGELAHVATYPWPNATVHTFQLPRNVAERYIRFDFLESLSFSICINDLVLFSPGADSECSSHDECGNFEYCDMFGTCWAECYQCTRFDDAIDGQCPHCTGAECNVHEACGVNGYCNEFFICEECFLCGAYRDSITGECPSCKVQLTDSRFLRVRPDQCFGTRFRPSVIDSSDDSGIGESCHVWDQTNWWCQNTDNTYIILDFNGVYPVEYIKINTGNLLYTPERILIQGGFDENPTTEILRSEFLEVHEQYFHFSEPVEFPFWRLDFLQTRSFSICINDVEFYYTRDFSVPE